MGDSERLFRVVHPFHPLYGGEFELLCYKQTWGEHRVFFQDAGGRVKSLPASWADVGPPDPFVIRAAGRAFFRVEDLLALVLLMRHLGMPGGKTFPLPQPGHGVKEITP